MGNFDIGNFTMEMENERDKEEFGKRLQEVFDAYNTGDVETILDQRKHLIEFGYRSEEIRGMEEINRSEGKKLFELFFNAFESFEAISVNGTIKQIGNVILVIGFIKETMTLKDGQKTGANVRLTSTYMKIDGQWTEVLAHRDTQFDK